LSKNFMFFFLSLWLWNTEIFIKFLKSNSINKYW
jgi:hypothetical protein